MTEILSAEEAVACADDCYPDDGTMVTASVLRLLRSHEALRRRLAEVEAERDEARRVSGVEHGNARSWKETADAWATKCSATEARLAEVEAERDELWSCPDCAFTFDAVHTDEPDGNYSCPACAEVRLIARLAEVEAERDANATARDAWERLHGELSALTKRDLTLAADRVAAAEARLAEVEQALRDAIECVESWAAYASGYFQEKHDLAGDLARLRAVLDKEEPDRECGIHGPDATYVTQMESYCTCRNVDKGEPDG